MDVCGCMWKSSGNGGRRRRRSRVVVGVEVEVFNCLDLEVRVVGDIEVDKGRSERDW